MARKHDDEDTNMVEVINISSETVRFELDGAKIKLGPKERHRVHRNYARPRAMQPGRDPVPSQVEMLTGGKVLSVDDKRARVVAAAG